ncbi:MAG: NUDIX hydrolase [Oscillospiraceae bacterium]|nr:NUDIX hydrolase [Oscillospiraceae bacterium]
MSTEHLQEQQLSSETVFEGRILHVMEDRVLLENGETAQREVIRHPGGACVVPLTADGDVILVKQFRYPHRMVTLEVPAGKLNEGENPLTCAERELMEEVGASAEKLEYLGSLFPTPAYDTEVIHMYLARSISLSQAQNLDEGEFLDVVRMPLKEAVAAVMRNEVQDAKTQIALLKTDVLLRNDT